MGTAPPYCWPSRADDDDDVAATTTTSTTKWQEVNLCLDDDDDEDEEEKKKPSFPLTPLQREAAKDAVKRCMRHPSPYKVELLASLAATGADAETVREAGFGIEDLMDLNLNTDDMMNPPLSWSLSDLHGLPSSLLYAPMIVGKASSSCSSSSGVCCSSSSPPQWSNNNNSGDDHHQEGCYYCSEEEEEEEDENHL